MMRRVQWALFAVVLVAPTSLAADPNEPDLATEIAWVRALWPDGFSGVHFHAPLARLLKWVPRGRKVNAFVYTPEYACLPAELARAEDGRALAVAIVTRRWTAEGRRRRELAVARAGTAFESDDSIIEEVRAPDGAWQLESSSGYGLFDNYGALSSVKDGVARFDGEALDIAPYCNGPFEWLPCPRGGEHPCERCEAFSFMLIGKGAMGGRSHHHENRPVACNDACPSYPENSGLVRLRALRGRLSLWKLAREPSSNNAALYRSREDCLREHPTAVSATTAP